jgi:type IV secretion system protein VirD4
MVDTPTPAPPAVPADRMSGALRRASAAAGAGIYLGAGRDGWAWAEPERAALVLGPSRSGKTSSLVIPNVLAAAGPVVTTSTKADVLEGTARSRREAGWTLLYDPTGTVDPPPGVARIGWSPVSSCRSFDRALMTADAMVRAAAPGGRPHDADGSHWRERATALLGPLLHAAAVTDEPMATVLAWVDRHRGEPALEILAEQGREHSTSVDVLSGILTTEHREQSGIWSTASGALAAYRSAAALASTRDPLLDPDLFCAAPNTLYVCATGNQQRMFAPLVVGVLGDVRDAAYRTHRRAGGPPTLFALDEVAHIAPLPDLPQIVTEGGGQGLLTLACLQDLSQARARWGHEADAFVSLFGTTVVLPGIADLVTLDALSAIGGDAEVVTHSVSVTARDRLHGRAPVTRSAATTLRRRFPVDTIARGAPGSALVVDARNRLGWVTLTPAHRTLPWRDLLGPARTPVPERSLGAGRG